MKKIIRHNITNLPYSLHDGVVIAFEVLENNLVMKFQSGLKKTTEPYEQISGSIKVENIDWDFSFVYLFDG